MLSLKCSLLLVCSFLICINADINLLQNPEGVYSECINNGDIAITFDDGPSSNTVAVLDVLKEKGIRATFFITGNTFDNINDPATHEKIRRIVEDGHQLGSHTWSHMDLTANQSSESIRKEMVDLENKVKEILGFKMTIMRPPYGHYNDSVLDIIHREMNYSVIMWSLDTEDWTNLENTNLSFQNYINAMEYNTHFNSSFIALHHDFAAGSPILARQAIDYVREKGFRPVTISECIGIPDNNGVNCSTCISVYFIAMCFFLVMKI